MSGKETRLAFGACPAVSLNDARAKRAEIKALLASGRDPSMVREAEQLRLRASAENTFEKVARDWHRTRLNQWQPGTAKNILHRLELDIFPTIGRYAINEVPIPTMLATLRAIEKRGALEIAKRLTADCSRIFNYAIRCGMADKNPAALLGEVLEPRERGYFAAIGSD